MSEENSFLFAEYAHPVANKGKIRRGRALFILLYIFAAAAYAGFFVSVKIPHLIAILPLLLWILVHYTWGNVSFEYFTRVDSGALFFGKMRGKKQKVLFSCRVKELAFVKKKSAVSPDTYQGVRLLDFRYDPSAEDCYAARTTVDQEAVVILFDATDAVLTAMRYYNKSVER